MVPFNARWIRCPGDEAVPYNRLTLFRRDFRLQKEVAQAELAVSADTRYRLRLNGRWLADGPARAYPAHYSCDLLQVPEILRMGLNRMEAEVRFFGCGSFGQAGVQPGFFARLAITYQDGSSEIIESDDTWQAAIAPQLSSRVPKISIQQGPFECYDARLGSEPEWKVAEVIPDPPWQDLSFRETPMLSCRERLLQRVVSLFRSDRLRHHVGIEPRRLADPARLTVNGGDLYPVIIGVELLCERDLESPLLPKQSVMAVNGEAVAAQGGHRLRAGKNFVVAGAEFLAGHLHQWGFSFPEGEGITVGESRVVILDRLRRNTEDLKQSWADPELARPEDEYRTICTQAFAAKSSDDFCRMFPEARILREEEFCDLAGAMDFKFRSPEPAEADDVEHVENFLYPDDRCTVIRPGHAVELCCDAGEQTVGYWSFTLFAPAGTIVDVAAVEYVSPEGKVQHTSSNSNGMRYICREGFNRFTSLHRRSGRYVFLTIRNHSDPVRLQSFRIFEATYPVVPQGDFHCSDLLLDRIYRISMRTLQLCMEDTFTDCPLYEQTLWIGDACNESRFALSCFGAQDIVRRCIRLGAQSLERMPLVGSQVPSGWTNVIPAFSFLWVRTLREYYEATGDLEFLREIWPSVRKELENAAAMRDPGTGLFASESWNFLDWNGTDNRHRMMVYNSQLFSAALAWAEEFSKILEEPAEEQAHFHTLHEEVCRAVNAVWSTRELAYPEFVDDEGKPGALYSHHTSILAELFDLAAPENQLAVRTNVLAPRAELLPIGTPFISCFLYEALEKLGHEEELLEMLRSDYSAMVENDATTVWEMLHHKTKDGYPTRSHCHAWSSSPVYFLPRLILGLRREGIGSRRYTLAPFPGELKFAEGAVATPYGPLRVRWERTGERSLNIVVRKPAAVEVEFTPGKRFHDWHVECRMENTDAEKC